MATYLVTGVAGFIGAKVAEFLLADGHIVVGVDNLNDAYDVRLKHWRLAQLDGKAGFQFHRLDITDRESLRKLWEYRGTKPFDAVINLAARAGVRYSTENPWVYFESNVTGTLNLLELSREFGVAKFILASSSSLYGNNPSLPWRENTDTDHPISPYAASKKSAETLCYTYHCLYGIDITVLRYFTVYGPAGRPDMMPFRLVQWISEKRPVTVFGDGQQSRDFTYIDDIARGTIAGLIPLGYEVINLGTDHPVVLLDAIKLMEKSLGQAAKLEFKARHSADVSTTWADIRKGEKILNWRPTTEFSHGLNELVKWYSTNREWTRHICTG